MKLADARAERIQVICPTALYTPIVPANLKRHWVILRNDPDLGHDLVIILPGRGPQPAWAIGWIRLMPGDSVLFSITGDMPWLGAIIGAGLTGTTIARGIEVSEGP